MVTSIYEKSTFTGLFMNFKSFLQIIFKKGLIYTIFEARASRQFEKIQDKTYSEEEHLENSEYESKSRRKLNPLFRYLNLCSSYFTCVCYFLYVI